MSKFKDFWSVHQDRFVLSVGGILLAAVSFGTGRLSVLEKSEPVVIEDPVEQECRCPDSQIKNKAATDDKSEEAIDKDDNEGEVEQGDYVASKNGSKYYLTSCSGANRIKEENKVWFDTAKEAEEEGYGPAKNCKGL